MTDTVLGHLQITKGTDSAAHPGTQASVILRMNYVHGNFFVSRKHEEEREAGGPRGCGTCVCCLVTCHSTRPDGDSQ